MAATVICESCLAFLLFNSFAGTLVTTGNNRYNIWSNSCFVQQIIVHVVCFVRHCAHSWLPFLWDSKGLLLTDYLPSKITMSGQYYTSLDAAWRHQGETLRDADSRSLAVARQRSSPQVHGCTKGCSRLRLRTVRPPCIQSWPGSQWLFSVLQPAVSPSWCPLSWRWIAPGSCQGVAGGTDRRFLF